MCAGDAKKNDTKPWQRKEWCFPTIGAEFVWRMEDILDLYAEAPDPARPRYVETVIGIGYRMAKL